MNTHDIKLPPLPEPDSFLFQHEETGLTEYVDSQQVEWGFEKANPRWQKIHGAFTERQMQAYATAAIEADRQAIQITGETSDGYHTFNELYAHRVRLFCLLMHAHKDSAWWSHKHHDDSSWDGWIIAGIDTPEGSATYHLPTSEIENLPEGIELPNGKEWDGHTPNDVLVRLLSLRQARGEPVAWTTPDGREPISDAAKESRLDLYEKNYTVPLYTTTQPQQTPEGYKLVPIEPTEEMLECVWGRSKSVYKAMLEAAPKVKK